MEEKVAQQEKESKWPRRISIALEVLRIAAAGSLMVGSLVAPGLARVLPLLDADGKRSGRRRYPSDVSRTVDRLKRRGYVALVETPRGYALRITQKGQELLTRYEVGEMKLTRAKRWDGRWRMVIFDIQERRRWLRDKVRDTLESWGFYRLQDSVWLFPHPCEEAVELLKTAYSARHDVLYVEVAHMAQDNRARQFFGLLE